MGSPFVLESSTHWSSTDSRMKGPFGASVERYETERKYQSPAEGCHLKV